MNHLDLFSGIGGFALAARWAGFETIQFVEKNKFCQKVLEKNFPNIPIHDDVKTFHPIMEKVELLTGGFPCQPFSIAGTKRGIKDDRYLWPQTIRVIKESKPRWVLLENVPGIVPYLDPIIKDLETEGYTCWTYLIAASLVGAPHKRERLWIIANRDSERCDDRSDTWKRRHLQNNEERYISALQQEWEKLKPEPWKTMSAEYWLKNNAYFVRANDGIRARMDRDRIKALGNAIVPQVVYPIMKIIYEIERKAHE